MNGNANFNIFSNPILSDMFGVNLNVLLWTSFLLCECCEDKEQRQRCAVVRRRRIDIDYHWETLINENEFKRHYRMSSPFFETLLCKVGPHLHVNEQQSMNRTGVRPLPPSAKLMLTLSWLAGGDYRNVRMVMGISRAYFYAVAYRVMDVIAQVETISFPTTAEGLRALREDFTRLSHNQLFAGCIGCIDGLLVRTITPNTTQVTNIRDNYSGHYKHYGRNVQACCDAWCRFTSICCNAPGGMNDALAFRRWNLRNLLQTILPPGHYLLGDAAYPLLYFLIIPFFGRNGMDESQRTFNFYLSQLRIRIEMTFGILVNKWRILKTPLHLTKESNVTKVIHTCALLHNFVITENLKKNGRNITRRMLSDDYNAIMLQCDVDQEEIYDSTSFTTSKDGIEGIDLRNIIMSIIEEEKFTRPVRNIERNG